MKKNCDMKKKEARKLQKLPMYFLEMVYITRGEMEKRSEQRSLNKYSGFMFIRDWYIAGSKVMLKVESNTLLMKTRQCCALDTN